MKLFVDKNEEIIVQLFSTVEKDGTIVYWTANNSEDKPSDVKDSDVSSFKIVFKVPNYSDTVFFQDSGMQFASDGSIKISSSAISFARFARLLKSWDFKDDNGNPVEPSVENIGLLDPIVAKTIVEDLESQISF